MPSAAACPLHKQVPLNEYDFPQSKLASVQAQLERLVEKNYYLHQSARDAYRWAWVCVCVLLQPVLWCWVVMWTGLLG